jgi:hypothetical protein
LSFSHRSSTIVSHQSCSTSTDPSRPPSLVRVILPPNRQRR